MPMTLILCSVVVRSDPATVYDYMADTDNDTLWRRDPLRTRPGVIVTGHSRPDLITFAGEIGNIHTRGAVEFHAEGPRTRIIQQTEVRGRGPSAVLIPFVARHARRVIQANLFRLALQFTQPSTSSLVDDRRGAASA
jgi:hypothetical protein